ncbi:MAG: hypothetical protein JWQ04_3276 [Pedosphaera sp.]|nr:hypothetical protein [Pedosphaera sp.]
MGDSDSDHSLKLLIKTDADLAAFKKTQAETQRTITEFKKLGKDTSALEAEFKKGQKAIADYGKETEKGSEGSRLFSGHMGEVKKSIRELGHEFPLAATALRLLTNPVGGALAIAIGMFAYFKQKLDEWNKSLDETAADAAKSMANFGAAMADARRETENAADGITAALKKIADAQKEVTDRTNEDIEAARRKERAKIALTDAGEAAELAEVDAQRKLNQADPKQGMDEVSALKREAEIKLRHEQHKIDIQNAADQAAIVPKENQLNNQILEQGRLQDVIAPLEADKVKRAAKIKDLPGEITNREETLKLAGELIKAQVERIGQVTEQEKGVRSDERELFHKSTVEPEEVKLKNLYEDQTRALKAVETAKNEQAKFTLEQKNYDAAKDALDKIRESIKDLTRDVTNLLKTAKEEAHNREQVFDINKTTEGRKLAGAIIGANKDTLPPGQLPAGVIKDPKTGEITADPKLLPGYQPPPITRPIAPAVHHEPAHELSPQEIEARGGSSAAATSAQRAKDAHDRAEQHTREIARKSAEVAEAIAKLTETVLTGHGNLAVAVQQQNVKMKALEGRIKSLLNQ